MPQEIFVDVSELEAPEPFERIMPLVRALHPDQYVKVLHRKEPYPLYEILIENGYSYKAVQIDTEKFCILIWLCVDNSTADYCQKMDFNQPIAS